MTQVPNVGPIDAEDIDDHFVPTIKASVSSVEIEDQPGLVDATTGRALSLNESAAMVVDYIDGERTVGEIIDGLAVGVGVDADVLRSDVIELVKRFGRDGMLEDVRPYIVMAPSQPAPESLPLGTQLPDFSLVDLTGRLVGRDALTRPSTLLINWSPTCGWCDRIAPDLVDLQDDLASRGVEVILLSRGSAEANVQKLEELGLSVRLLLNSSGELDLFGMTGTPAAYALDEGARIASALAVGGFDVPRLAAELAGRMPGE